MRPSATSPTDLPVASTRSEDDISEDEIREIFGGMRLNELQQLALTAGIDLEDVEEATELYNYYNRNPIEEINEDEKVAS